MTRHAKTIDKLIFFFGLYRQFYGHFIATTKLPCSNLSTFGFLTYGLNRLNQFRLMKSIFFKYLQLRFVRVLIRT